ncbi:MAG: response regulator [Polyangia bacterium]
MSELTTCDVLVADDDEDCAHLLEVVLRQAGYSTRVARTGTEVLRLLQLVRPALILMDWWMPELDGLECTRRIRSEPELCGIPIVAVTAGCLRGDRERALAAGCDGYLTKPLSLERLLGEIRRCLAAGTTATAAPAPQVPQSV